MRAGASADITDKLIAARNGDKTALDALFHLVYPQLRAIAHQRRAARGRRDTLDTTELVHEAYMKLTRGAPNDWRDRRHFFATAAQAMRHILVDHARARCAARRGGGVPDITLKENLIADDDAAQELLDLDQALETLSAQQPRQAKVVECRFFAGLGVAETAEALDISDATVRRDWAHACTFLHRKLQPAGGG